MKLDIPDEYVPLVVTALDHYHAYARHSARQCALCPKSIVGGEESRSAACSLEPRGWIFWRATRTGTSRLGTKANAFRPVGARAVGDGGFCMPGGASSYTTARPDIRRLSRPVAIQLHAVAP